jgi:N-acetylmuramic acid 6-phosphate (MurNAc-6-P) etherase
MGIERPQTEQAAQEFSGLDTWDDTRILSALAGGQERAIAAVRAAIPQISKAATAIAARLSSGGRLIYAGAGTSIRVGVQDGSELPATFGMAQDRIVYLIAGGRAAMFDTLADAEDDAESGAKDASIWASRCAHCRCRSGFTPPQLVPPAGETTRRSSSASSTTEVRRNCYCGYRNQRFGPK